MDFHQDFPEKRGFFDKCQSYVSTYFKEAISNMSAGPDPEDSDESSGSEDEPDNDSDASGVGKVREPNLKLLGPYSKVSTTDYKSAHNFGDSYSHNDSWGSSRQQSSYQDHGSSSKPVGGGDEDWFNGWSDNNAGNGSSHGEWTSGGGSAADSSSLTARAPKTAAAKAAAKVKPATVNDAALIDLGGPAAPKTKTKDEWEDAWESLTK